MKVIRVKNVVVQLVLEREKIREDSSKKNITILIFFIAINVDQYTLMIGSKLL